jgi:hypothetical protein
MPDIVQRLLAVLTQTPREQWETRTRAEFGGSAYYFAKHPPELSEQVRELCRMGVPARTARHKVYGR